MEVVFRLPHIYFELKTSSERTYFVPKFREYISEAYMVDPDSYNNEIYLLESLRSAATRPAADCAFLSTMIKYYCQLKDIQSRFPMFKGQLAAASFTWKDLYSNTNCSIDDIRYEMACVLYNIGALHTQLGSSEPRTSADSLKTACTHYRNAAWAFQCLREQYPQTPGVDISPEIMELLQEMCFAQAQECILEMSIQDTKKPNDVCAEAAQLLIFYKKCLRLLGPSSGPENIHKIIGTKLYNYWHRFLTFKANYIGCIVYLFQGMHAEEQKKMGERVAYYKQAAEKLRDAIKIVNYFDLMQVHHEELIYMNDMVETKFKVAKNENDLIYHEEVPHDGLLNYVEPICSVEVLAIDLTDPEVSGPIIFSRLVPSGPHGASALYSEEKAKLLRLIMSMAEEKNTQMTDFISSLKLGPLNLDSDQKSLEETAERCVKMNAEVEIIETLVESMNNLAMIIDDVEHSLAEIEKRIQDDALKEKEYHRVMSPRPLSIVQMELSSELHEFQEAYARTHKSNQVLLKAMKLHISNLKMLSKPLDVSVENIKSTDNETISQMRRMIGKLENMKTQRDWLIKQLRDDITMDDIITRLLTMDLNDSLKQLFVDELEKHMPTVKLFIKNTMNQESIIDKLAPDYSAYGDLRLLFIRLLKKRESLIDASLKSYDEHRELLEKSQMAQEFYKKLQNDVNNLLARVWSTCQVQQEERLQLLPEHKPKTFTHWIRCCWMGQ